MSIEINNVSKRIKKSTVVDDVSLRVKDASIVAVAGPNGSGKTMLMRLVAGLMSADSGSVIVDGKKVGVDCSFPESIGLLIENPSFLSGYTGRTNLRFLASIRSCIGDAVIDETLEEVGLSATDRRTFRKYSLGMKQRLGLAAAVMESPSTLLLDEPSNALDSEGVSMLKRLMLKQRDRGASILWACHDRDLMCELSDEVYYLEDGRVCKHEILRDGGCQ